MKRIIFILIIALVITGCTPKSVNDSNQNQPNPLEEQFNFELPVSKKPFLVGTAGFTPATKSSITNKIVTEFWETTDLISDLHGVHVEWNDSALVNEAIKELKSEVVVVLGFQNPEDWNSNQDEFINRAKQILENKQVNYFAIGNEINTLNEQYPNKFSEFIDAYKFIYTELKTEFPNKTIFTVFQYETLIGEGYITGKSEILESSLFILDELKSHIDIVGLTSYPWFDYADPNEIPNDYFSKIREYTQKPIGFTEVGWISRDNLPEKFSLLTQQGFDGSEQEQEEYILKLIEIGTNENILFANWTFLDDLRDWKNGKSVEDNIFMFESIGLRNYNGDPKKAFIAWGSLQNLPSE